MATSQKLTEHFLTCPVCFEVFTNPSTLACDHTFCGQCVVSYTKTRPDAISARSLLCPFCERLTKVPDPQRPVEEWPSQMKPGLLLRGLLESFGPGSKDTTNCNLCHEEGETTPAAVWCSVCDVSLCDACHKAHRRNPASRHHDLSDLSLEAKVKRTLKVMCHEHKDEVIKFYCKDCKKVICQSCCIVYHRKCESVKTLESMMPEMKAVLEMKKKALVMNIENEEKQLTTRKSQCADIKQSKVFIQSQIQSTAQRVSDSIKKKEKDLIDELDEVTDKQMGQLKADIKTGDMTIQIHRQQSEFIDQTLNSDSEMDMYHLYQSCESGVVQTVGDIGGKKRETKIKIAFSQDFDRIKEALGGLGKIKVIREVGIDLVSTPVLIKTVECRTKEDTEMPNVYDVLCMKSNDADILIVTDFINKCLKSFYESDGKAHYSRLELQIGPRRIAKLGERTLGVTLPSVNQIVTVTVSPDLSLASTIRTQKQYYGLSGLTPTTLAAGSLSPPSVDILDRSGNVLKSISPLLNGQKILSNLLFLCTTKNTNILVADNGTKSIVCLTPQGDVVFNYSPTGGKALMFPAGITITDTGDILVADWRRHKVIQLSESGQFVRDILTSQDGLSSPYCLDYDESETMYVSHESGSIQMFRLA